MEKIDTSYRFFPWITGALMAGVLVVPGFYVLLSLWLALFGAWHARGWIQRIWQPSQAIGAVPIWVGMAVYVLFGISVGLFHGYKAAYFDAYVPMLLAPFIVNAVVVARPPVKMLWFGAAAAAVLSGVVASYQSLYLQTGRAGGAMNNVIMFGDLAVVLAMVCAFGAFFGVTDTEPRWMRRFMFLGTAMGVWASLLSGTKGGWISILMLSVILVWMALRHWHWIRRVAVAGAVLFGVLVAAFLAPPDLVVNRISNGLQGAHTWLTTGQITEGSVSIRLEKWKQAIGMVVDKPLTGWTTEGSVIEIDKRLRQTSAGAYPGGGRWTQTENDLLQAAIVHGLPGLASSLFLYFGFLWGFIRIRQQAVHNMLWVGLATVGVLLVVLMLEFGLSVVVLGRNAFRHSLIFWGMSVLAYLILLRPQRPAGK
ncbi:O-antigen ligase family protein [Limnohabitans sp. yimb22184]|uniref:O-antigen ligase family protein n=1 Tax=Limnohabitans sp. YIMB22184 TaxID=3374104 RepID=UPI003A847CA9